MRVFLFTLCLTLCSLFGQTGNNHHDAPVATWIRYDGLVNGYEVIMHCTPKESNSSYFDTEIFLTKEGKAAFIHQTINFDNWEPWQLQGVAEKDTVVIQNTHVSQHIDWTNILYFEDMDFDGEEELVVCGYPRPNRPLVGEDYIDCEDFTIYRKTESGFCQIHNLVFDELSEGLCRTGFSFDTSQKTITLTGFLGDGGFEAETFYFKNGEPFKLTYSYLNHVGAIRYDYQFELPNEIDKYQLDREAIYKNK